MRQDRQDPKLRDPLKLLFTASLIAGLALLLTSDRPLRVAGLLFIVTAALWLIDSSRRSPS